MCVLTRLSLFVFTFSDGSVCAAAGAPAYAAHVSRYDGAWSAVYGWCISAPRSLGRRRDMGSLVVSVWRAAHTESHLCWACHTRFFSVFPAFLLRFAKQKIFETEIVNLFFGLISCLTLDKI